MAKLFDTDKLNEMINKLPASEDIIIKKIVEKFPELEKYKHLIKFKQLPNGNKEADFTNLPTDIVQRLKLDAPK